MDGLPVKDFVDNTDTYSQNSRSPELNMDLILNF